MYAKLKMSIFMRSSVDCLIHVIRLGKLAAGVKTCEVVKHNRPPRTQADIGVFLGLSNLFRRFVPIVYCVAALLTAMSRKEEPVNFVTLCDAYHVGFSSFKQSLVYRPFLALPQCATTCTACTPMPCTSRFVRSSSGPRRTRRWS